MKIGLFSYSYRGMAEYLGDFDDRNSGLDESGAEKMPKGVWPKSRKACPLRKAFTYIG